jgi:uncharacterized protein (TIGR03437 family)
LAYTSGAALPAPAFFHRYLYPGLYLIFFTVPAGTPKGSSVPVQIQIGGVTTPSNITIAVQ